jgi:hypothetical protein
VPILVAALLPGIARAADDPLTVGAVGGQHEPPHAVFPAHALGVRQAGTSVTGTVVDDD